MLFQIADSIKHAENFLFLFMLLKILCHISVPDALFLKVYFVKQMRDTDRVKSCIMRKKALLQGFRYGLGLPEGATDEDDEKKRV